MMGLSTPSSGMEKPTSDYDDLFAPYEDEPKIVGIVVGHFLPLEV